MYHPIEEQELHPNGYTLEKIPPTFTEDECYNLYTKPRQTQTTIGLYLKKRKDGKKNEARQEGEPDQSSGYQLRPDPDQVDAHLERQLMENKGFWVDKPTLTAPLINKLRELYTVELPRKDPKKSQGIFYRPAYLELDYFIKLGKAGLLYPDEEISDSEEEVKPDETMCLPLRKKKYKICDPCKPKPEKATKSKSSEEERDPNTPLLPFKKIQTGCQCNYYGDHNTPPTVWDYPYQNEVDMIRKHELNKYLKPFKTELLKKNYEENPPVFFKPVEPGSKRTFPDLMLSNL